MKENQIDIISISELLELGFFIPDYQRGYRWDNQQVEDLLDDIANFVPKEIVNSDEKTWYCLQPLVVKKCDEDMMNEYKLSGNYFEVIDGQQRLTTLYLIGHFINEMWRGKDKDAEIQLTYQTRDRSSDFLNKLRVNSNHEVRIENSKIDYHYISKAYNTINKWIQDKKNKNFKKDNFIDKFFNNTKVIWYETEETDPITIFIRINMGKIPLTNAELIKALFLNSSNFLDADADVDSENVRLKQLEIASEWDRFEYALHNPEFWYFINESDNHLSTRIEFIFDLMANKPSDADEYYTFRHFSNQFRNSSKEMITRNWKEIKKYYQTLEEWFCNRELYHKIGFLISTGVDINYLVNLSRGRTKANFKAEIHAEITKSIKVDLNELEYGDPRVRRILLLHNIQSMLNNELETSRFPFDRYKNDNWDVEHISSVKEKKPKSDKHQKDWSEEALQFINDKVLMQKIECFNTNDFDTLYEEILNFFSENKKYEGVDEISNLVLLDSKTNRGYGNAVFPVKRKTIIEKDCDGTFIPLCTKNVFMKYYSNDVSQLTFWGEKDRSDYLNNIKSVLSPYI